MMMSSIITMPEIKSKEVQVFSTDGGSTFSTKEDATAAQVVETYTKPAQELASALYPSTKSQNMVTKAIIEWELYKRGISSGVKKGA